MAIIICYKLPAIPPGYSLTLPGMGELTYLRDTLERMPRPSEMLLKFLNSIGPALAPVYSLLKVLDLIQAIIRCVMSVKDCITTLSPFPLIKCFSGLFEALAKIIPLLPPIVYLKMVVDIISLLRMLLDDILSLISIIDFRISEIKRTIEAATAAGDAALIEIAECAKHNLMQQAGGLVSVLEVIGKFIGTLLIVLDMIASFLPPSAAKEFNKVREAITGAAATASSYASASGFPALQPILEATTALRDALYTVESIGKAVLGNPIAFVQAQIPELQNP